MTLKPALTRATLVPGAPIPAETSKTTTGPHTVFREVTERGIIVEIVATEGYPLVLIVGHPECGRMAIDVTWNDFLGVKALLREAAADPGVQEAFDA